MFMKGVLNNIQLPIIILNFLNKVIKLAYINLTHNNIMNNQLFIIIHFYNKLFDVTRKDNFSNDLS